jgi:hypothetical protein
MVLGCFRALAVVLVLYWVLFRRRRKLFSGCCFDPGVFFGGLRFFVVLGWFYVAGGFHLLMRNVVAGCGCADDFGCADGLDFGAFGGGVVQVMGLYYR